MRSSLLSGGLLTEWKTVFYLLHLYCRDHHQQAKNEQGLCQACDELLEYAHTRLDRCPYGQTKPACNACPIHCYKAQPKEAMRQVMRYSGPKILLFHPWLALRHLWHERRKVPSIPAANLSNRHQRKRVSMR